LRFGHESRGGVRLNDGVYGSIAEMADKERINRSYLSRTIRLSLLAPDIVEAILDGTQPATLQLADLEGPFSIDWEQQRLAFGFSGKPSPQLPPSKTDSFQECEVRVSEERRAETQFERRRVKSSRRGSGRRPTRDRCEAWALLPQHARTNFVQPPSRHIWAKGENGFAVGISASSGQARQSGSSRFQAQT
jgi:hypothetical protein